MMLVRRTLIVAVAGLMWFQTTAVAFAQLPEMAAPLQPAPNQVGVAAAVQGHVQLARPAQVGRIAKSGEPVFLGDAVTTDAQSHLQIMLLDQTIFTIGPSSAITIDTFIYDPNTDAGKVSATIAKGVFRFVSGRIAHKAPENMTVKLPTGTIGVRGTIVAGVVEGDTATVALVGPGAITVSNAGTSVDIGRVGFGTTIGGSAAAPTIPAFMPPAQLQAMAQALGPMVEARGAAGVPGTSEQTAGHPSGSAEGQPSQTAPTQGGQGTGPGSTGQFGGFQGQPGQMPAGFSPEQAGQYAAMMGSGTTGQFGPAGAAGSFGQMGGMMMGGSTMGGFYGGGFGGGGSFGNFNTTGFFGFFSSGGTTYNDPYSTGSSGSSGSSSGQTQQILDGISKKEELRQIQSGIFHFSAINATGFTQTSPITKVGSIRVDFNVDFGARTVGGGTSKLIVNTVPSGGTINAAVNIPNLSFDTGTGQAVFSVNNPTNGLTGTFAIKNSGGVIGNLLDAGATVNNGGNQGQGSITNIPIAAGPAP